MRAGGRRRHRDQGVSEIISYIFMFGLGAIALTLALNVLSDTTTQSNDIASGSELRQVGELAAGHVQGAVSVVTAAPKSNYVLDFDLPASIGPRSYKLTVVPDTVNPVPCPEEARLIVTTDDGDLTAEVSLGNVRAMVLGTNDCLDVTGTVHSSAGSVRVIYDPTAEPEISLSNTPR